MNPSRIRRCMIEPEDIWSKNVEEKDGCGNLAGLQKFTTCEISQHCSPALPVWRLFDPLCLALYKFALDVILVPLHIFVISLILSTYISSVKLVTSINYQPFQSINHSKKLGAKFPLLPLMCDFLSFSFTFLHFLTIQTPLDDDKSSDA